MSRLNTCEDHDDAIVVWDGRGKCPLCTATEEVVRLKDQLDAAREVADDLQEELKEQIERLAGND